MDFDNLKDKAEDLAAEHSDQVEKGLDAAGDKAAERFGHDEQIDQAVDKAKDHIPGQE